MNSLSKDLLYNKEYIRIYGTYTSDNLIKLYNSSSGISFNTTSSSLKLTITSISQREQLGTVLSVIVNRDIKTKKTYVLKEGLNELDLSFDNSLKEISILKNNEAKDNYLIINNITLSDDFIKFTAPFKEALIIGDSTTAGYGNLGKCEEEKTTLNSDSTQDFLFMALYNHNYIPHMFTASGWGVYASIWTDPKTLSVYDEFGKVCVQNDLLFDFTIFNPEHIFISLGTNDETYINEIKEYHDERYNNFKNKYLLLLEKLESLYPTSIIHLVYGSINEERIYGGINDIYNTICKKYNNIKIVRVHSDNLGCSNHPSLKAHYNMEKEIDTLL